MRAFVFALAAAGLGTGTVAAAQQAQNSPESIICAVSGSCADDPATTPEPGAAGRPRVGSVRGFSLARPNAGATVETRTSAPTPSRANAPSAMRRTAATASNRRAERPARVRPGGGIDMQVSFRKNSAELTAQAQAEARAFAKAMAAPQLAGMRFAIEGHTDASGPRDHNMELSRQRAQSVVDYLVSQGVESSRLSAIGYGPDRPIEGQSASAPANRRVEFVKKS